MRPSFISRSKIAIRAHIVEAVIMHADVRNV